MNDRTLIVARLRPGRDAADVARLFDASDRTELPAALGVRQRHLFTYRDLYFHYVEFDGDRNRALAAARERDDFRQLSADLDEFIVPFDPATWRSPADAMAECFYAWRPER